MNLQPKYYISEEDEKNICNDYTNRDLGINQLSMKYNRNISSIKNVLRRNNIQIIRKNPVKKYIDMYDDDGNLLLKEATIGEIIKYLKDNELHPNPCYTTISSNAYKKDKLLYGKFRLELVKEIIRNGN